MIWGVAGLQPNFFSSGRIFLAELAQESWRDLAAVAGGQKLMDTMMILRKKLSYIYFIKGSTFLIFVLKSLGDTLVGFFVRVIMCQALILKNL